MSDEISDDIILDEFAQGKIYETLIKIVSDSLHEKLKSTGLSDKSIDMVLRKSRLTMRNVYGKGCI